MFIDLSVTIDNHTPVYPGDPPTKITPVSSYVKDGFNDHHISTGNHAGTHVDAPSHMLQSGISLDAIDIDRFIGPGKYIQVENNEFSLDAAKQAGLLPGDIVLFHTGMSDHFHEQSYYKDYPAMSAEIAQYLVGTKVKMVGLDTGSADNQEGFPIHKILLGGDVLIIENLTNVGALADKNFTVYALPIKLQVDGAPARVIAQIFEN